jgi:prepilin-type N-terminal cleavage/methylation domain-containing protein
MVQQRIDAIRKRKADEGFTLIELLIVIVVLGILATIVVFGVATFRTDAQVAACKADLKTVSVAADAYNAKTGAYPADIATLVTAGYLKSAPVAASALTLGAGGAVTSTVAGCTV